MALVLTVTLLGGGYIDAVTTSKAIYRGSSASPKVALMINVYEGTEYVEGMLKVLEEKGVKCTFFLGGIWVARNPKTAATIVASGQEIGSHGYHHLNHSTLSRKQNIDELAMAEKQISAVTGVTPTLFAPPSGDLSSEVVNIAESLGYKVIMWSKDTIDWRDKDESLVYSRATNGITNGEFILIHPTSHTLKALPKIIDDLRAKGLSPSTVSECLIT